jgi:hypothetical protein
VAAGRSAAAQEDQPGGDERPQKGDLLVLSEGDRQGEVVRPGDLTLGGPPVHAWPQDPKSSVIRKGPRLNEILVIKLDPGELDEETRSRSADGIVAYSVICTHAGFPVSEWVKAGRRQGHSEMSLSQLRVQPRESAQVVFGLPRRLAALPKQITDGSVTIAGTFVGKVGDQRAK